MQGLQSLFEPRGIAVIGATPDPSRPGGQTMRALAENGYAGGIFPVNPKYEDVAGFPCFASILDVPDTCDVAVIALPAAHVAPMVALCGQRGVRAAVVLGGGFREAGETGRELEAELLRTARAAGVRLIGPNCLGFVNIHARAYAAFGSLARPPLLQPGAVSAVIQSGGYGNSVIMRCAAAGIGFRHVAATGNEVDITTPELIAAFAADPQTKVILVYIEGVTDGRAFLRACRDAREAGKHVVVLKAGNTRQGARAAASHTANMTGSYEIYRAAFRQAGIIEALDVDDAVDDISSLLGERPAQGRGVAIMGGSGGSAVVFSDAADAYGLEIVELAESTRTVLRDTLPSIASLDNPIDFAAGFLNAKNEQRFLQAVEAVLADPGVAQLGVMLATMVGETALSGARALAEAATRHGKPIFVFWAAPHEESPGTCEILTGARIPIMSSPRRMARAMATLANRSEPLPGGQAGFLESEGEAAELPAGIADGVLNEYASKQLIARFGIQTSADRFLPGLRVDAAQLEGLRFPQVLKIVSADIAHKSDVGGVRLSLGSAPQLAQAAEAMADAVRQAMPQAQVEGFLACEMVPDGLEAIVGVVADEVFGPVVAFGLGGVFTEVLADMTYRIAPFGIETARSMVAELRSARLFDGLRGQSPRDVEALAKTLSAVSQMAWQLRGRLAELDINPLLVLGQGKGVIAADALVVLRSAAV